MATLAPVVIAIDQGTTSSRVVGYSESGKELLVRSRALPIRYPRDGWVEQDPNEIWESVRLPLNEVASAIKTSRLRAIGITNQRETVVCWSRRTGRPLGPAIVWQCRRTAADCSALRSKGLSEQILRKTGLVIDPYFSATKICWLLKNVPAIKRAASVGDAVFGTVDSWILYQLTGGAKSGVVATEPSNASRTMLVDLNDGQWSPSLLELFSIKRDWLPEIRPSAGFFGTTRIGRKEVPVTAILGDQQASLFGNGAVRPGQAKCTFGTGAFLLANTGDSMRTVTDGLLTTIAWRLGTKLTYAREGSVFVAGSAVQWLRDGLGLIRTAGQSETAAAESSGGVCVVPAFTGLGAPHWDSRARGAIYGITRDTTAAQLVRATLEGVAHQVADLFDTGGLGRISSLGIDGGMSANKLFATILADLTGVEIVRSPYVEMTAFGAARAAMLGCGEVSSLKQAITSFSGATSGRNKGLTIKPQVQAEARRILRSGWREAIARTRGGVTPPPVVSQAKVSERKNRSRGRRGGR
jgi:glycerol kinase